MTPESFFPRTHTILRILLIAGVVIPLALFVVLAWATYQQSRKAVEVRVDSLAMIGEEHALRAFEIARVASSEFREHVRDKTDRELLREQQRLQALEKRITGGTTALSAISVFDADGVPVLGRAIEGRYLAPIAQRPDYDRLKAGVAIDVVHASDGIERLALSMPRADTRDHFGGIVSASMRADYFTEYYRRLVDSHPGTALLLLHADGSLMARYPALERQPVTVDPNDDLIRTLNSGAGKGTVTLVSPIDGTKRYMSYNHIPGYPVYVLATHSYAVWQAAWYRDLSLVALLTLLPTIALCIAVLLARRHLIAERETWQRWQAEIATRKSIEAQYGRSRRLEALGQLTSGVAHDFGNLLSVVSTSSALIDRCPAKTGECRHGLSAIFRSVDKGRALTQRLLSFSRMHADEVKNVDVRKALADFAAFVRSALGGSIDIDVEAAPDLPAIQVNEAEMELAFLNLAVNARDAMPQGGRLTLRATCLPTPDGSLQGRIVTIEFHDTGGGIPPEIQARIFEPFYTTKAAGKGTGLGLAQVRGFCLHSGGAITVHSAPGEGTRFVLHLPAAKS